MLPPGLGQGRGGEEQNPATKRHFPDNKHHRRNYAQNLSGAQIFVYTAHTVQSSPLHLPAVHTQLQRSRKILRGPCPKPHIWSCSLEDKDRPHLMPPLASSQICWTGLDKLCSQSPHPLGEPKQHRSCGCHPAVPYSWSHLTQQPPGLAGKSIPERGHLGGRNETPPPLPALTLDTCSLRNRSWQRLSLESAAVK